MKRVEYEGDLRKDLKEIDNEYIFYNRKYLRGIEVVLFVVSMLVAVLFLSSGIKWEFFVLFFNTFMALEFVTVNFLFQKWQLKIWDANFRVNDLVRELEDNDVLVNNLELENEILLNKKEKSSNLRIDTEKVEVARKKEIVKYWTFLDRNDQIQVLKAVKNVVVEMGEAKVQEQVFLLEEEDKSNLDSNLKRVLRINK